MSAQGKVCVYIGEGLRRYGFGQGHPFGPDRMDAFWSNVLKEDLEQAVCVLEPKQATVDDLQRFHTKGYVERVIAQSQTGAGLLDYGDTPAFKGIFEAASFVVGTTVDACERLMTGACLRAFTPIGGLHHARRDSAGGFCVFNDPGVAVETLRTRFGLHRFAYVDIDAHHGDGMYYAFAEDPDVFIADIHEDGRFLYPGTGQATETGTGAATGTKLNIPMLPDADDASFMQAWAKVEDFVDHARPEFIFLQCGADSLAGDPITHLRYTAAAHAHAARRLCTLADKHCHGRLLAMGGGGYNRHNLAIAWTAVVRSLLASRA
nr:acetoin utilization protein AcuC [Gammaproteobacteria bacterium]